MCVGVSMCMRVRVRECVFVFVLEPAGWKPAKWQKWSLYVAVARACHPELDLATKSNPARVS